MKDIKAVPVHRKRKYVPTEAELEDARHRIICYDVVLSEDEATKFDRITQRHYEESQKMKKVTWGSKCSKMK